MTSNLGHTLLLKRDTGSLNDDHYEVYLGELYVGRIFNRIAGASAAKDTTWFWGIDSNVRHLAPMIHGHAATKDEAMAAFRSAWDKGPRS